TLPLVSVPNSNDRRVHWAVLARKRRAMREAMGRVAADAKPVPGKVRLLVGCAFPDKRHRDLDNLEIKGAIDGLVDAGVIEDDRSTVLTAVTRWRMEHKSEWKYVELRFEIEGVGSCSRTTKTAT